MPAASGPPPMPLKRLVGDPSLRSVTALVQDTNARAQPLDVDVDGRSRSVGLMAGGSRGRSAPDFLVERSDPRALELFRRARRVQVEPGALPRADVAAARRCS